VAWPWPTQRSCAGVQRFAPEFEKRWNRFARKAGPYWRVDYLKVRGKWTYLYRAVDQHGQVIDVLLPARRDLAAARDFFT